jgi:hypothetical protein
MCPALILAANRNDNVIGRTVTLVVSINTKNGFNQSGAPSGRKWAIDFLIDLANLDMIIDNHKGRPKINVKIRWLEVLKKYGISPIKLIKIIVKNNVVTVCLNPFRLDINVRDNWAVIIISVGDSIELFRVEDVQNVNWVIIIKVIFIIINRLIEGFRELNLNGSNEEKISGIIQDMEDPFITLKVISLFNLMSYILINLSQEVEVRGFRI